MIRLILGQPGSGKTLSAVKRLVDTNDKSFTNFTIRKPNIERIRMEYVIEKEQDEKGKVISQKVNWDFWKEQITKHGGFHIFIDELHNVMHSRMSMSKRNVLLSQWVAQIRKVTGENEYFDFVCVSQELERVDIAVRDLTWQIIACQKIQVPSLEETTVYERGRKKTKKIPITWIIQHYFSGPGCVKRYQLWRDLRQKTYNFKSFFHANPYMQYYDSYELVDFGSEVYL